MLAHARRACFQDTASNETVWGNNVVGSIQVTASLEDREVPKTQGVMLCAAVREVGPALGPSIVDNSMASRTTPSALRPFSANTRTSSGRPGNPESNTHKAPPSMAQRMGRVPYVRSTSQIQSYAETALWLSWSTWSWAFTNRMRSMEDAVIHFSRVWSSEVSHAVSPQRRKGSGCMDLTQESKESRSS